MSYLVLARKFRPQTFESVVGQDHISCSLANAIVRGRVPHAFLFTGPRGVGKTTSARVLARALNCTGRPLPQTSTDLSEAQARKLVEPCGECVNCREIAKSCSVAVWEIDGASNNSVDNVRELIDSLKTLPPPGSHYKIYIIDEVHMLSVAAFNALLKSLEEPPPNTIFVFATTEPHKIPETVISRCQRHDFIRIAPEVISARLQEIAQLEGIILEDGVCEFIARKAEGGMRDAQSMLDRLIAFSLDSISLSTVQRVFGAVDCSHFIHQTEAVLSGDLAGCFLLVDQAFEQSIDVRSFFADFVEHWRNLMLLGTVDPRDEAAAKSIRKLVKTNDASFMELAQLASRSTTVDLQRLFDVAEKTAEQGLRSAYPRYVLEAGLAKMASLPSLEPVSRLLRSLGENKSVSGETCVPALCEKKNDAAQASPKQLQARPSGKKVPEKSAQEFAQKTSAQLTHEDLPTEVSVYSSTELFNPSWQDFLAHVRTRGEILLDAVLKRVSPRGFTAGSLVLEAAEFDLDTLRTADMKKRLEDCLKSYSSEQRWSITFEEHLAQTSSAPSLSPNGKTQAAPVPGSVVAREKAQKERRRAEIEKEAAEDPLVLAALSVFEGSNIEKIQAIES